MKLNYEDQLSNQLPLTEATFFILLSLVDGRKHGYAILKDVRVLSQGRVRLSTGTLYGAITRLLDQGLIERVNEEDPDLVGRPRKFYELSFTGQQILQAESVRLSSMLVSLQQRLGQAYNCSIQATTTG